MKDSIMLSSAFALGSVLFRLVAIVQQAKLSQLNSETLSSVDTLCARLNLDDVSKVLTKMSSYNSFIESGLIHKIEASLQEHFGIQTRTAFSLGNFLCISSVAPTQAARETTLCHAEICARSLGLDEHYVEKMFSDIRKIPTNSIQRHQQILLHINRLHDELEKIERDGRKKKALSPQIVAAIIVAIAAIVAALIGVLLKT